MFKAVMTVKCMKTQHLLQCEEELQVSKTRSASGCHGCCDWLVRSTEDCVDSSSCEEADVDAGEHRLSVRIYRLAVNQPPWWTPLTLGCTRHAQPWGWVSDTFWKLSQQGLSVIALAIAGFSYGQNKWTKQRSAPGSKITSQTQVGVKNAFAPWFECQKKKVQQLMFCSVHEKLMKDGEEGRKNTDLCWETKAFLLKDLCFKPNRFVESMLRSRTVEREHVRSSLKSCRNVSWLQSLILIPFRSL